MEQFFATMFEDLRYERSLVFLITLTDPDAIKQSKFTEHQTKLLKNIALEKLHRQGKL